MTVLITRVSLVPQATAYVLAMWQAVGGDLAGVSFLEGPVALEEMMPELVVVGDATSQQHLAHFGVTGLKREETAAIEVTVYVAREGSPQTEVSERAAIIGDRINALVENDFTFGGLCHLATLRFKDVQKYFYGSPGGREVYAHYELEIIGRVS